MNCYNSFSEEPDLFSLEIFMKFRLSEFHLLTYLLSSSLYISLGKVNEDRKIEKTSTKSCLFKLSGSFIPLTKEQSSVTKRRAVFDQF